MIGESSEKGNNASAEPGNNRQRIRKYTARIKKADQGAAPQETKSIEEAFRELEVIVGQMESGDSTLGEPFVSYEVGIKLMRECSLRLDKVEKQIMVLAEDRGGYESQ